jgi:glycosyltransferase involved in cell wall biosynthesis
VLARVPAATLAIVGAGPAEASLRAQAAALGVDHRVEQRGALPRSAIAELYRSSAVAVIPSREGAGGAEGQSLVAVEAMACECPVVATRSGGLTFLVGASERGILVSPDDPRALADAIVATLADPDGARRRARAASEYVRARFTWQSIKPRLLEVYAEATARRSARC